METTTNSNQRNIEAHESKDEVDFVVVTNNNNNNNNNYDSNNIKAPTDNNKFSSYNNNSENTVPKTTNSNSTSKQQQQQQQQQQVPNKESTHNTQKCKKKPSENSTTEPKKSSTKERLSLFSFGKKNSQKTVSNGASSKEVAPNAAPPTLEEKPSKSSLIEMGCQPMVVPMGTPPRQHKFVKSSSIARLLGNTYNAKKFEKQEEKKRVTNDTKFNTFAGRRRLSGPYLERFKRSSKEDGDVASNGGFTLTTDSRDLFGGSRSELVCLEHFQEDRNEDLGAKAFRTISRGLGKLWWKRTHSVEISTPDPEFKVSYLGNVLTGWSKGEGCVEKQLNTLWRNYTQNSKPDVIMRIKVCASGLKATTRQHGLTEYWANRITHCCAPKNYPRVFCWIYRHEGRKLKHELRCHAVLCSKEKIVQDICNTLKENLERALREFKREKILKQNARLSLANAAYDNPSLPRRKILLSVGGNNYRPPLERSKSAPKLMAIEEAIGEEEGEEIEETNEPEMRACCQKDSLYPAMTLGRRRCRRGHSIRRTGKTRPNFSEAFDQRTDGLQHAEGCCGGALTAKDTKEVIAAESMSSDQAKVSECGGGAGSGSDDSDDFDKILKYNDYDTSASLANELLPYFDMQLHKNTSSSLGCLIDVLKDNEEPLSLLPTINSDPSADPEADYDPLTHNDLDDDQVVVGLRRHGVCSDGEEDYLDAEDMYFRQASILNMLHRNSMRKMQNLSQSSDESSIETNSSAPLQYRHQGQSSISSNASSTATSASTMAMEGAGVSQHKQLNPDSDEGSISSGCETASTVTANQDDLSLKYRQSKHMPSPMQDGHQLTEHGILDEEQPITAEEIYQRLESRLQGRHNSDATTFSSSSSITLKMGGTSPTASVNGLEVGQSSGTRSRRTRRQSSQREQCGGGDSDSECSDESGYVEYQQVRGEKSGKSTINGGQGQVLGTKPQPPPKPMPRKLLPTSASTAV